MGILGIIIASLQIGIVIFMTLYMFLYRFPLSRKRIKILNQIAELSAKGKRAHNEGDAEALEFYAVQVREKVAELDKTFSRKGE